MRTIASVRDLRGAAQRRLPHFLFEYYDGAAFDGDTAAANESDLRAIELRQHVLRDVSQVSLETELFGRRYAMPLALSPVGMAGMAARRGEVQAARAAVAAGIPMTLSTASVCPLDEVATVRPPWLQLYLLRDPSFTSSLLDWAMEIGCDTLVVTVDLPVSGTRWRDGHSGLYDQGVKGRLRRSAQIASMPAWALDVGLRGGPHTLGSVARCLPGTPSFADCMAYMGGSMESKLDRAALDRVRAQWSGKLIVKGIIEPDDARTSIAAGADAIVVSNHGGRQLDGVTSTARALPRIADTVGDAIPLLVDGGVRTGVDVLRMLALGARMVMVGRPWVFALAAGGEAGVARMLTLLKDELRVAVALTGCREASKAGSEIVARVA